MTSKAVLFRHLGLDCNVVWQKFPLENMSYSLIEVICIVIPINIFHLITCVTVISVNGFRFSIKSIVATKSSILYCTIQELIEVRCNNT